MLSRRKLLAASAAAPLSMSWAGSAMSAGLMASLGDAGPAQIIKKVDAYVIRVPGAGGGEIPMDQRIEMPPIGTMRETYGLGARIDHASPSRFFGRMQTMLVRIETDQGLVGWGEAHAVAAPRVHREVIDHLFAPVLIGQNALRIVPLWERMYSTQRTRGFNSAGFFSEAMSAVDIALWDILGKHLNVPVYQLLGGKFRDRVPTYKAVRSVEDTKIAIRDGFTAVKTGFFKGAGSSSIDRIAGMSEAASSKGQVFIDALGAFRLHEAIEVGREFDKLGNIGWFEDALLHEDSDKYPLLAEALDTAICVGETYGTRFQFRDLIAKNGADVVNPDIGRAGGLTECKRIADLADVFGVLFSPHVSSGFPPYVAASLHLAVAVPNAAMLEGGEIHAAKTVRESRGNLLLKNPIKFEPGFAYVPEGPGLGIEFDEALLRNVIEEEGGQRF
jgi:L-alanine-DL-glutamate epimerase-like enolase superfamily enzyme